MKGQTPAPPTVLYVVVSEQEDGTEGIVAEQMPGRGWAPFVFVNRDSLEKMKPRFRQMARESGQTLRIVRFTGREVLEEFKP